MSLQLPLNAAQRIRARPGQIFSGIVQFVLIEVQLSLCQINLLLRSVLVRAAGGGKLLLQLIETIPIGFNVYFGLGYVRVKLASFGRRLRGVIGGITEGVFESEVNFVIRQAQGLIREPLFVPIRSQLGNVAGGLDRKSTRLNSSHPSIS